MIQDIYFKEPILDKIRANIEQEPYIESPTMIYAIKKFDIMEIIDKYKEGKE